MTTLTDYFMPLNASVVFQFISMVVVFDAMGFTLSRYIKFPSHVRMLYWVFGQSMFVFLWFVLHFFLPFERSYIVITLMFCGLITLPNYIKSREPLVFVVSILRYPYPLLLPILIATPMYSLLSLPPVYWDEMSYHYYSPARVLTERTWQFYDPGTLSVFNVYSMMPRLLDTAYVVLFSVTRTYASARMLHLFVFLTSIYSVSLFVRKYFGVVSSLIFAFVVFFMRTDLIVNATSGFVDAGAISLLSVFTVTLADLLLDKKTGSLYAPVVIGAIASGIKYTSLPFIAVATVSFMLIALVRKQKWLRTHVRNNVVSHRYALRSFSVGFLIFLIFGGYWYIKNFFISADPVFPLLSVCKQGISCNRLDALFGSDDQLFFNQKNFGLIRDIVFLGRQSFFLVFVTSFSLIFLAGFIAKKKSMQFLTGFLLISLLLEIVFSTKFLKFEIRYFYHWVFLIALVASLPFGMYSSLAGIRRGIFLGGLTIYSLMFLYAFRTIFYRNVGEMYGNIFANAKVGEFTSGRAQYDNVTRYATGRVTIYQWVDQLFPQTSHIVRWCDTSSNAMTLLIIDPAFLINSFEGLSRMYFVGCSVEAISPASQVSLDAQSRMVRDAYRGRYLVSLTGCNRDKQNLFLGENQRRMHLLNQSVVCQSKPVMKHVYVVD